VRGEAGEATLGRELLAVVLLAALLFLPFLGLRDLWNPDEARYAEVAYEMREAGSWALPRLNGEIYTQKPPLFFWLINAAALVTGGVGETAARLPSALAAIAATALVFRLGWRLFGRRAAWIAAAVFATSFKVLWQGRFGQIDMVLTAFVALAMWWFVRGYGERRPGFYALFFVAGGLATLAKGPAGLLPPLLAVIAFLLWSGEPEEIRRLRIGRGLLLWALVVLAWLVPAGIAGGREYLDHIVLRQNLTRYADPWHHFQPWYYYLTVVPGDFFPWSFLLPTAAVVGRRVEGPGRQGVRLAACWVVVTLLFFSISPAKRSVYVLTMYPAMALLVAAALDRLAALWPRRRRWGSAPFAAVAGLVTLIVAAVAVVGPRRPEAEVLGGAPFVWLVAGAFVPLLAASWAAWTAARRGRLARATGWLAGGMGALMLAVAFAVLPRFDVVKSARQMSAVLLARMAPGEEYGIYPRLDSTFVFYSRRYAVPLGSPEQLRAFAARPERVWVLAQRDDWARLDPPPPLVVVASDADPLEGYLLLTQPAGSGGPPPP
jgi:4-amino-4-deoxy-L-arabinose transferase-like glycosyltransferase